MLFFFTLLFTIFSYAQEITGQWNGALKIQGMQLRIAFMISEGETGLSSTMDSPDQGAFGIPVTSTTFENDTLTLKVQNAGLEYIGVLDDNEIIVGKIKQGGMTFPMDLSRDLVELEANKRPQEPKEPFPYYSEEVVFSNKKDGVDLSGTLTLPSKDGKFPVVILISGSGPQDRNEEIMGHKPFLVLSDYLTQNGIAVLRYDDRGTAASTGDFSSATSADFSRDVEAGVNYLKSRKDIDKRKIGLIGHSEGGLIASMVASRNKKIAFIVLLAGPGIPGDQLLLLQQKLIGKASGISEELLLKNEEMNRKAFEIVNHASSTEQLKSDLTQSISKSLLENPSSQKPAGMSDTDFVKLQVDQIASPWMQYFIKYDPAPTLKKVKCPVLALNGSKDLQVPPNENLGAIKTALENGKNKDFSTVELPNLNHLFQECTTGAPSEYAEIEETFSPNAMEELLDWINEHMK